MVSLTKLFTTTHHAVNGGEVVLEPRPYLGMSQLGNECPRFLWYQFHWAFVDKTSPRMVRLWARGHREEPVIIEELEKVGISCDATQHEMIAGMGHIKGHNDGTAYGVIEAPKTQHLLEFKTVKDSGFKELCKKKLLKYSPTYYGQCQLYMHFLKLDRTLFIAVNKNDDNWHVERLHYDRGYAEDLIRKGNSIIMADSPPARAYPSKTFYKCKWCAAQKICWDGAPMQKNCRTCTGIELCTEGQWACRYEDEGSRLTEQEQRKGCETYQGFSYED